MKRTPTAIACVLLALAMLSGCADRGTREAYRRAGTLYAARDYAAAGEAYASLGGYRQSEARAQDCQCRLAYDEAQALAARGQYAQAEAAFAALDGFSDSARRASDAGLQDGYASALSLCRAGRWEEAESAFSALGDFRDSVSQASRCGQMLPYVRAQALLLAAMRSGQEADYADAIVALEALRPFAGSTALSGIAGMLRRGDLATAAETILGQNPEADGAIPLSDWREGFAAACARAGSAEQALTSLVALRELCTAERYRFAGALPDALESRRLCPTALDETLSACGKAPAGKLLIFRTQRDYGALQPAQSLDLTLMALLPEEVFPSSLAEAEYLLVLSGDAAACGRYGNHITLRVRETTTVSLYHLPERRLLYTGVCPGPDAPETITYAVAPEFVSGGPPPGEALVPLLLQALEQVFLKTDGATGCRYFITGNEAVVVSRAGALFSLPDTLGGAPVVAFPAGFFAGERLVGIRLPSSLRFLPDRAFEGCAALSAVLLPDTLESIGERAFSGCAVGSLLLPAGVKEIGRDAFPAGTVLLTASGSAAERYARENDLRYLSDGRAAR